ncbi:MAG: polymer-forming cytoskeletal protein [Eubacteriales bacterium]|nr:polymer-forming cytoskeletal protein [Eubacteriales bacterium]
MGFRENFKQALDEMIGTGNDEKTTQFESSVDVVDVSMISTHESEKIAEEKEQQALRRSNYDYRTNVQRETIAQVTSSATLRVAGDAPKTIITAGTSIKGDITCQGDLDVNGTIVGNVTCEGLLRVTGKIEGDVHCANFELISAEIRGQVTIANQLLMRGESVIIGDLSGDIMEINGKIKGNITVGNSLHLLPQAYVLGDMSTRSIQIESGAVVFGRLNITTDGEKHVSFDTTSGR